MILWASRCYNTFIWLYCTWYDEVKSRVKPSTTKCRTDAEGGTSADLMTVLHIHLKIRPSKKHPVELHALHKRIIQVLWLSFTVPLPPRLLVIYSPLPPFCNKKKMIKVHLFPDHTGLRVLHAAKYNSLEMTNLMLWLTILVYVTISELWSTHIAFIWTFSLSSSKVQYPLSVLWLSFLITFMLYL